MSESGPFWCSMCGRDLDHAVLYCPACEQWWRDNPPPAPKDEHGQPFAETTEKPDEDSR